MATHFNAFLWGILLSLFEWDFTYDIKGDNVLISKGVTWVIGNLK